MGKTEPGKRERENTNGKDCEEESEACPQGKVEEHGFQALRQRPSHREARSSSGCAQGQGSPPRRLKQRPLSPRLGRTAALRRPAELFLGHSRCDSRCVWSRARFGLHCSETLEENAVDRIIDWAAYLFVIALVAFMVFAIYR